LGRDPEKSVWMIIKLPMSPETLREYDELYQVLYQGSAIRTTDEIIIKGITKAQAEKVAAELNEPW
jgi:hypothetical protein